MSGEVGKGVLILSSRSTIARPMFAIKLKDSRVGSAADAFRFRKS